MTIGADAPFIRQNDGAFAPLRDTKAPFPNQRGGDVTVLQSFISRLPFGSRLPNATAHYGASKVLTEPGRRSLAQWQELHAPKGSGFAAQALRGPSFWSVGHGCSALCPPVSGSSVGTRETTTRARVGKIRRGHCVYIHTGPPFTPIITVAFLLGPPPGAVSYTHLTLPTICSV